MDRWFMFVTPRGCHDIPRARRLPVPEVITSRKTQEVEENLWSPSHSYVALVARHWLTLIGWLYVVTVQLHVVESAIYHRGLQGAYVIKHTNTHSEIYDR